MKAGGRFFLFLIILLGCGSSVSGRFISLSNDYIRVFVDYDTARFYMENSSNDFGNKMENNKFLLFKKTPPTSFTTFSIDNQYFIYGGDSGNFKKKPVIDSKKIQCEWIIKDVSIVQEVGIVKGPDGFEDAMLIIYKITNKKNKEVSIGLRILFDTVTGEMSARAFGTPGQGKIEKETRLLRNDIPQYWYYLDSYDEPVYGAQGITSGDGVTKPDKIIFANWGRLTEIPWELMIDSTKDFRRPGTSQYNGSVAVYYDPAAVSKDKSISITNEFGKYSPSIFTENDMLMSLNVPKEPLAPPISVAAELINKASAAMDKLEFEITVPKGFKLSDNETNIIDFFKVETNASSKVLWNLMSGSIGGNYSVSVKATGWINNNVKTIEASKDFIINYITGLPATNSVSNYAVDTNITIQTNTNSTVSNIQPALPLVVSEQEKKLLGEIRQIDDMIEEINEKYQILMGIYKNIYTTNGNFLKEINTNIQSFEDQLHEQEFNMSNEEIFFNNR